MIKASAWNAGDLGSIPGLGRSPGEGNGNPLRYSCLENPMDRGAWEAAVHGVAKSRTRLIDFTLTLTRWQSHVSAFNVLSRLVMTSLVAQTVRSLPAMWETWVRSLGREDLLGKEMATHSGTLAWRIPWREKPGRLQCMGSQRLEHD